MDFAEGIRVNAMHSVLHGGSDYSMRHVMRWYSKTFHTPLNVVETLPVDHILTHYYEETYENMEEPSRNEERERLYLGSEQYEKKQSEADAAEEAFLREAEEEAARSATKKTMADVKPVDPKPPPVELPEEISIKYADTVELDVDGI
jgi:hypothetical protein